MTLKKYNWVQFAVMAVEIIIINFAIQSKNYLLGACAVLAAVIALNLTRKKVTQVIADERDYQLAGTAARYTLNIITICMAIAIFIAMIWADKDPVFQTVSTVLSFAVMGILFLSGAIHTTLRIIAQQKSGLSAKEILSQNKIIIISLISFIIFFIVGFFISYVDRPWKLESKNSVLNII